MPSLISWRDAVLSPIDERCAVGSSARLSDLFDRLQLEVSYDLALEGSSTDWQKVLELSHEVLATQSKDLLVLVYSMRAVIEANRYHGIEEALSVFTCYVAEYWVDSFPPLKRKRGRIAALEWFAQQLEEWVASNKPEQSEKDYVESVLRSIKATNQQLAELDGEWHLDLFSATRNLNDYLSNIPDELNHSDAKDNTKLVEGSSNSVDSSIAEEPIQADVIQIGSRSTTSPNNHLTPAKPSSSQPSVVDKTNVNAVIVDEKAYSQSIRDAQSVLKNMAKYRLSQDLSDPRAYEINRFSIWLPVSELPLHQNGLTPLRSIPAEKRHFFDTLFQQRQYESLVVEIESSLSNAPFWLDGHRMVINSLEAIDRAGSSNDIRGRHQSAIDVISELTKSFVTRLDGIECLKFSDDLPFANDETRAWLANIETINAAAKENSSVDNSLKHISEAGLLNEIDKENSHQEELEIIQKSNIAYKESGFSEGFLMLDQYCHDQTSKKMWYKARLMVIEYCLTAKEFMFAEQLLIELDELTIKHQLDVWEPQMVSGMLSMMLLCKAKLKRKQSTDSYYQRLVRVNAKQGYEMKSFAC